MCESQLQALERRWIFLDGEWLALRWAVPGSVQAIIAIDKTRKIHDDYIFDFVFDDGHIENIYLVRQDTTLHCNKVQVIKQFAQTGSRRRIATMWRSWLTALPLVQIELKKRGVAIREAFNQVHRYSKESFNADNSLFKYLQLFVISNGTDSRYFANTTQAQQKQLRLHHELGKVG